MVKIGLQIRAQMESCTGLEPEGVDFRWYLKLRCGNCGDVADHWQYINLTESHPLKGGRGEASCVLKCKLCARENSIDILKEHISTYDYDDGQSNKFKTIVAFDCRGLEPVDFSPRNGWNVKGYQPANEDSNDEEGRETGTLFTDVDLTEKEWADFDEKSGLSTCISELEHTFVKLK